MPLTAARVAAVASALVFSLIVSSVAGAAAQRMKLDDGWRFAFGAHEGADRVGFPDSDWERVTLPHTWNAQDAFTKEPSFREGDGWYRRHVAIGSALRGQRLILYCEAANQVADVYWNGVHAGRHAGGYTAFAFDVTEAARPGDNLLAIRVNNAIGPVPPLIADYNFYGGLYRDVWLVTANEVHFSRLDHAAPGAWAEATGVSDSSATVRIRGRVTNSAPRAARVTLVARVRDHDGTEVSSLQTERVVEPAADSAFELPTGVIRDPRLWSPDSPHLYDVQVQLLVDGRVTDETHAPLGLRWFSVDPGRGLSLNGRPLRLNGTNRHQDHAGHGSAVPERLQRADLRRIKADGFNFVRLAHYPQSAAVLDECDRLGLVVWEEIPVVNRIDTTAAFEANARAMLVEMIRQHRGHPSILFWGLANEALLLKPDPLPAGYAASVARLVRGLHDLAHAEDPGRLTAAAVSFDEIDDGSGVQDVPDVLGLNLYFGWYYRTLEELGPWLDAFHARHSGRPVVISEYGADSDERVHARDPHAFDFSIEYQQRFHEATFPQLESRHWIVGTAVWNQFDFGSRRRDDSKPNLNKKGLYFFDRRPKDVACYYRARLSPEPILHIAARDWARRAGSRPEDAAQSITVYSNLEQVELWQGRESLGRREVLNGTARWEVTLGPGNNALIAKGTRNGRTIEDRCTVSYEDRDAAARRSKSPITLAMNASACQYVDSSGTVWEACHDDAPGGWGPTGGALVATHHRIFGTREDALFQSARDGIEQLQLHVPDGTYDLELCFAETQGAKPGDRVFDVSVNGEPVCTALDPAREGGAFVAVTRTARVQCRGGGGLQVTFTPRHGRATWSAVKLARR